MLCFNLEGFHRNKRYLANLLHQLSPRIVFLQEIWLHFHDQKQINDTFPDYSFKISTPDMFYHNEDKLMKSGPIWHGAAIGWHNDIASYITFPTSNHERLAGIKLSMNDKSILLVSFYAPTAGHDDDFLESVAYLSEYILQHSSVDDQIVIGTDSNCSANSTTRRKASWKNFCETHSFQVCSKGAPTFHHNNGSSKSCIDFFVTSRSLKISNLSQYCTLETPLNLSSHDPITASIVLQVKAEENKSEYSNSYTDFNREKVLWDAEKMTQYQELATQALAGASEYWDTPESIPLLCSLFSNLLVKCAKMVFTTSSSKKSGAPKCSNKILQAEQALTKAFKKWKNAGKPPARTNPIRISYTSARSNLQRVRRNVENLQSIQHNNFLMHSDRFDRSKVFSRMKKLRGEKSATITSILHTPVGTFHGDDVLEGFTADAEHLGNSNSNSSWHDRSFYKLCKLDNLYIFDIQENESVKQIPSMTISQLDHILLRKMKSGKSCDIYQLTVEHLRNLGPQAKLLLLQLINRILNDIYYLSCQQIKLGLGTALYKGKNKPISKSNSYRRITVTPIIGAIIDYYIDPEAESTFRIVQSPDQLGFTAGLSYLLAAIQRGECQRWAIDQKLTCFGVSLDGEAAFPSVERQIQVRELYSVGERGDYLQYSRNTYQNTECHLKLNGKLGRKFSEEKGNRQGHVRASGHFKAYINPLLKSLNKSCLGFHVGPLCITALCVADDTYVLSGSANALQSALNIVSHYGKQYQVKFNADKTKIVVAGSKVDMNFYQETSPWYLNDERVLVVDTNEHLGLQVSGQDEEQKNVDQNIQQCRKSLFGLLGPAFSFKCLLSPVVQIHLWRTYNSPVLLSGLAALPLRPPNIKALTIYHNKTLRGFLKLSGSSPTAGLYFLLGELPVEARLHIETLTLFHNIVTSPQTTVNELVKYILKMSKPNSTTWSNHVKLLCQLYGLPNPLSLLEDNAAWSKSAWKCLVETKVTIYHENALRKLALPNSKMNYLNVQLSGLSGNPHPALLNILTTQQAKKLRLHLKFLTSDFLTGERLAQDQPNIDPGCKLCLATVESTEHVLITCRATADVRQRLYPELMNAVAKVQPTSHILQNPTAHQLTQFILDCTSINLGENFRIPAHNPGIAEIFRMSRDWCFALSNERGRLLRLLSVNKQTHAH